MIRENFSNCEPRCSYFLGTSIRCEQRRWEKLTGLEGLNDANLVVVLSESMHPLLFVFVFGLHLETIHIYLMRSCEDM